MVGSDRAAPRWLVEVSDECASTQQCIASAPDLFRLDEDGFSRPVDEWVDDTRSEDLRRAVDGCPVGAIGIVQEPAPGAD